MINSRTIEALHDFLEERFPHDPDFAKALVTEILDTLTRHGPRRISVSPSEE